MSKHSKKDARTIFLSYASGMVHKAMWKLGEEEMKRLNLDQWQMTTVNSVPVSGIRFATVDGRQHVMQFNEEDPDQVVQMHFDLDSASAPDYEEEQPKTLEEAAERMARPEERPVVKAPIVAPKGFYGGGEVQPITRKLSPAAEIPERIVVMPPGYRMEQVARWLFFFSPKTFRRISEEIIADYRHEMVEAEAKAKSKAELRTLKIQHWGGFILAVISEMYSGIVGKIVKAFKGS